MNKAKKRAFIDEALIYLNAAKEAYSFDDEDGGSSCINITDLNDNYVKKSGDTYTGTITTELTNGNYVQTINLTNGKYYLISSSTDVSVDDVKDSMPQGFKSSCGNNNSIVAQCPNDVPLTSCEVTIAPNITGISSVDVVHGGKNLLDESTIQNGYQINANTGLPSAWNGRCATTSPITIHGGNITVSFNSTDSLVRLIYSFFKNGTFVERVANIAIGTTINAHDYDMMYIGFANVNGTAITKDVLSNIQIEYGSTATSYEPYTETTTYTASLGRTIYGGVVDMVQGTGTETYAIVDLSTLSWVSISNGRLKSQGINSRVVRPSGSVVTTAISTNYTAYPNSTLANDTSLIGFSIVTDGCIAVRTADGNNPTGYLVFPLVDSEKEDFTFTPINISNSN